ncbi:zinc ribbon domain-containing protein [Actinoplanes sp. HUAS TT8]|uniref:zinc ribbon domain-containing protein n=1 Tax=Actinoplanes sp. HUAS TT8 TaxID=3447453 RepID=UPI003F51C80A
MPVTRRLLAERAEHLTALVQRAATELLARLWTDANLDVLAAGVDATDRKLPSKGWMALRRLGWTVTAAPGVRLPDRVARIAEEEAARALRLSLHRRAVTAAIISTWPADPRKRTAEEWVLLRACLPAGTDRATIRNRTRQVIAFASGHGRLPSGFTELETPPRIAGQVLLAAADRQLVRLQRTGERAAQLWVQLPVMADPASYRDWTWHDITVPLPPTVSEQAALCTPTLRVRDGSVRVDLPFQTPMVPAPLTGHRRAIGADWGYNTLLTAVIAEPGPDDTVISYGRPLRFDATGISRKLDRLRLHREHLKTRISHLQKLAAGRGPAGLDPATKSKLELLDIEHAHVCARIRHLGHTLAWAGARWLIDQAHTAGATVVYLEDLTTMEAPGSSRAWNRRLSGATRGILADAVRHLGAKEHITVVTVPARGTSSGCPRCGQTLRHVKAPDNHKPANPWALCSCGHSADRDFSAALRIAARGIAGQQHTARNRAGEAGIRTTVDVPVHRRLAATPRPASPPRPCRDKHRPTPPRPRRRKAPGRVPGFTPAAHATAGSRPAPSGAVQRPAGRTPQNLTVQVPGPAAHTFSSNPLQARHRVRGAVLGRGFHHHVTSTPLLQRRGPRSGETPGSHRTAQKN